MNKNSFINQFFENIKFHSQIRSGLNLDQFQRDGSGVFQGLNTSLWVMYSDRSLALSSSTGRPQYLEVENGSLPDDFPG